MTHEDSKLAVMANNIEYIKRDIAEVKLKLERDYVTRNDFEPIRKIIYGIVSIMGVAVVGALMTLVLRQ